MSVGSACKRRLKQRVRCTPVLVLVAVGLYQKALWDESTPLRLLPVSSMMLERSWEQHEGDQGEVNSWDEAMTIAKVKKERRCDEEGGMEKEQGVFLLLYPERGLGTFCTPTHLLWRGLHVPKTMSKWLAKGCKRLATIQIILHPFMAIRAVGMMGWSVAVECYKPFRRRLLHCCSSWIT